jgi:hypothetical protein
MERRTILMSLAFLHLSIPKTRRREGRQLNVGPGITAEFPLLTDEQVASVARRGTRHHTTAGEVLYAAGERGYDFIVVEAAEVDVLRPAMPNAPKALIATWGPRSLVADRFRIRSRRPDKYARCARGWCTCRW